MRLNKKVMLSVVALPFCAALIGCADTIMEPSFESGVVQPATSPAPVVKAPVYKNGDWWKVKMEWKGRLGSGCAGTYSDYLLEIQEGKPKVYGINGANKEEFDCPGVTDRVLGKITRKLQFPLRVGNQWTHRYKWVISSKYDFGWKTVEYEVLGWEKVQTPRGAFEAFKLSSYTTSRTPNAYIDDKETYYFSPKVKAIILIKRIRLRNGQYDRDATNTIVDFNVSN